VTEPFGAGHVSASTTDSISIVEKASHVEYVLFCEEVDADVDDVTIGTFTMLCRVKMC